jgi:hypothetical protein
MKLTFEDRSYIEVTKSVNPDKIFLTVAAKSADDTHKLIVNSVELTTEQLLSLVKSST